MFDWRSFHSLAESDKDGHAEVDVENVELEIRPGGETCAFLHSVGLLLLLMDLYAENTKADIEADIIHNEDTQAGREVQRGCHRICACVTQFSPIITFES